MSRRARRRQERAKTSSPPQISSNPTDDWGAATFIVSGPPKRQSPPEPPPPEPSLPLQQLEKLPLTLDSPRDAPTDQFEENKLSEDITAAAPIKTAQLPKRKVVVSVEVDPGSEEEDTVGDTMDLPISALSLTTRSAPKYILLKDQPCKIVEARMKKKVY